MSKFARLGQWVLNGLGADIENIEDLIGEYPQLDNTKEVVKISVKFKGNGELTFPTQA